MKDDFFKLLAELNKLKKNKKSLRKENPEAFQVFLSFLVTIEENLHFLEKDEYVKLTKDLLNDQITVDDFSYSFMAIYEGINEKLSQMLKDESLNLANFLEKPRRRELSRLLAYLYGVCDSFNLDPDFSLSTEKELKNYAQELLLILQKK